MAVEVCAGRVAARHARRAVQQPLLTQHAERRLHEVHGGARVQILGATDALVDRRRHAAPTQRRSKDETAGARAHDRDLHGLLLRNLAVPVWVRLKLQLTSELLQ
eukprot:SAG11_NODE_3463_length_2432_cov_39.107158_2_plen_105_part_00